MTCFFDPSHGPGSTTVTWVPQWGVPRPIQTCVACGQRVQSAQPPYYTPPATPNGYGYPQQGAQQGYGGGYPQGYGAGGYGYPAEYPHQRHGHSTGAVVGAGVAGLVGGALLNEMLDDDRPEVVENFENVNIENVNPDAGGFFDGYDDQSSYSYDDGGDGGDGGGDFEI